MKIGETRRVDSTSYVRLPDGPITVTREEPRSYDGEESRRYLVRHYGIIAGWVWSRRVTVWRKHGRIRTSVRGRPTEWYWSANRWGVSLVGYRTRAEAIKRLLEERVTNAPES